MTQGEVEAFLAIYQQRNLSKAAKQLYISQPSLSSKLSLLEKELNCQLFIRRKGHPYVIVSDAGEKFYPLALQYMELIEKMHDIHHCQAFTFRIGATNSIWTYLLTSVCEQLMEEHPDMSIAMQDTETEAAYRFIEKGTLDFALTPIIDTYSRIPYKSLFKEPMVFVCSCDHHYHKMIDMKDLVLEDEIYVQWSGEFMNWHKKVFGYHVKMRVEMMSQLQYLLKKKNKWAFVPLSVAKGLKRQVNIEIKPLSFSLPDRMMSCIYSSNYMEANLDIFLQCLKEQVKKEYGDDFVFMY